MYAFALRINMTFVFSFFFFKPISDKGISEVKLDINCTDNMLAMEGWRDGFLIHNEFLENRNECKLGPD